MRDEQVYCSQRVHEPGAWRDSRCPRLATGDDGMCGPHRAGQRKREQSMLRWDGERRQDQFVHQWRRDHPDKTYTDRWSCSLCGYVVQVADAGDRPIASRVTAHIDAHGQDWTDYEAATRPADQEADESE